MSAEYGTVESQKVEAEVVSLPTVYVVALR